MIFLASGWPVVMSQEAQEGDAPNNKRPEMKLRFVYFKSIDRTFFF